MKGDRTATAVNSIVGVIIVGACAYIGYMIADTEITSKQHTTSNTTESTSNTNTTESNDTQRNIKILSAIGGGLVGLGIVGVIYWIIQRKEEPVSLKTDLEVLRRYSRIVPKE